MRTSNRYLLAILALAASADAGTIILNRAWIEQFKDRATIDANFIIDHAHPRPNAAKKDGDMHVAGRAAKEVGLPMVAEIMNAAGAKEKSAVDQVHAVEGKNQPVAVTGAWRLWFEHPPTEGAQTQFDPVPPAQNTNPDHCFEIHPITRVGDNDVKESFREIKGFTAKDAAAAFGSYEKLSLTLKANDTAVTLTSQKSGYNYVLFNLRVASKSTALKDGGLALFGDVVPVDEDDAGALAKNIRMIFVAGTVPFQKASKLAIGDEITVLGIPRLNLNAISAFLKASGSAAGTAVKRKLPYEMIVVSLEGEEAAAATPSRRPT